MGRQNISKGAVYAYFQPSNYSHLVKVSHINNKLKTKENKINFFLPCSGARPIGKEFHTTPSRKAPPPQILEILIKLLRQLAINVGRNMPADQIRNLNKGTITAGAAITGVLGYVFYVSHLQECPITKRKKFVVFSENQIMQMAARNSEVIQSKFKGKLLKSGDVHRYVSGISSRILRANRMFPGIQRNWRVFVVDDKRIQNAFVLPNGHIFIFTGMINVVSNEDQLAAVMGHEIAHALLNHVAELVSKTSFMELLLLLPIIILWSLSPDAIAILSQKYTRYISELLFELPMSRQLETEADVVGVVMMARACYDPRQAVEFWKKMAELSEKEPIEWFSTHPSHKTRYVTLENIMPEAMSIYEKYCK